MSRRRARMTLGVCLGLFGLTAFADEGSIQLIDGPGREMTSGACVTCHSLDYIPMNAPVMNRGAWDKTVHKMIDKYGAPIRHEDVDAIVTYLSAHYSG
jgi:sulfite dehydrogenase (cytochrome) subunit B